MYISVLLNNQNHELNKLIVQSIKNDLGSAQPIHINLALQCIANIAGKEMAMSLGPDIPKLLTSGDVSPDVKQSASLCLLKLLRTCPEAVPHGEWATRVVHLLNDHHLVRSELNKGGKMVPFQFLIDPVGSISLTI